MCHAEEACHPEFISGSLLGQILKQVQNDKPIPESPVAGSAATAEMSAAAMKRMERGTKRVCVRWMRRTVSDYKRSHSIQKRPSSIRIKNAWNNSAGKNWNP